MTLCRPATGMCDLAESCDGVHDGCPPDTHIPDGTSCDDGNACTTYDACAGGVCVSGDPTDCDDFSICTADSCDPGLGCQHTPTNDGVACDDYQVCTTGTTCANGRCTGGVATDCDDGNVCTDDVCYPPVGCLHTPSCCLVNSDCDDGNTCTSDSCLIVADTSALTFDGATGQVRISPADELTLQQFTLEAWINGTGGLGTSTGTTGIQSAIPLVARGRRDMQAPPASQRMNYFLGLKDGKLVGDRKAPTPP